MNKQMENSSIGMQMIKKYQFCIPKLKSKISEIKFQYSDVTADRWEKKIIKEPKGGKIDIMQSVSRKK